MTNGNLSRQAAHPKVLMQPISTFVFALMLVAGATAHGQNTAAQASPQTKSAAPAAVGGNTVTPPAATPQANGGTPQSQQGRRAGQRKARTSGNASRPATASKHALPPAVVGNASVGVIGDANGDGILDRNSKEAQSAALPGITMLHNAMGIATGTPISVRLEQSIDSGHAHNGDTVRGVLAAALGKVPSGAPVTLTVVASAAAGQIGSNGTLSLQVVSINGEQVLSQVITAEGKEGQKTLPDDAPARGTEAVFTPDQPITIPAA